MWPADVVVNISGHMSGRSRRGGYSGTSEAECQPDCSLSHQDVTCPGGTKPSVPVQDDAQTLLPDCISPKILPGILLWC